jgi:hypothetical protein
MPRTPPGASEFEQDAARERRTERFNNTPAAVPSGEAPQGSSPKTGDNVLGESRLKRVNLGRLLPANSSNPFLGGNSAARQILKTLSRGRFYYLF